MDGLTPEDMVSQGQALQRKYATRRKRYARSIGIPYSHDTEKPEPGVLDLVADEDG